MSVQPRSCLTLFSAACLLFIATTVSGVTHVVYPDGTGEFATIQDAINAAVHGDTILLGSGTFTGLGNKNLDTQGKAICITSICSAESTVIDCQSDGRAFHIHNGENHNTVIHAIKVINGQAATVSDQGGAIYCENASPTIIACILEHNDAYWGGAIYLTQSNARIIRNRFLRNNCWLYCDRSDAQQTDDRTPRTPEDYNGDGGGIYCLDSDLQIIDNYFSLNQTNMQGHGTGICAFNSTLSTISNEFCRNGTVHDDWASAIYADSCDVQILGNYMHNNSGWYVGGICIKNSTGSVIANRLDSNYSHIGAAISSYSSSGIIGFNLLRDNYGDGISLDYSTSLVHRNIIARSRMACCGGSGVHSLNSPGTALTNNVLYENLHYDASGSEINYWGTPPEIKANVMVNSYPSAMIGCAANWSTIQAAIADTFYFVENVSEENFFFGNQRALWNSMSCLPEDRYYRFIDPMFCDPASDNWFLQEGSWCMGDTVIHISEAGNEIFFHVYGFVGALPVSCSTSDVLLAIVPPDDEAANCLQPGEAYELSGFSITNISNVEAPVYYELRFEGAAAPYDQGDPLAFGGVTPILQPGETFSPPEAALIVPAETPAVSTITYLVAYAPALNMPDTLTTTIFFDTSVPIALQGFTGTSCDEGVLLEWQTIDRIKVDYWNIYRSESKGAFRSITPSPLP
ncbi:MAG: hypothetical protein HY770_04780, partial [Chitinivibrionia bacterium]|nr:hypothetical protein [Chitinivibrionia bacterium]